MAIFGMGVMVGPTLGPDAGRLDHRQLLLALDLLHQPAARAPGRGHDLAYVPEPEHAIAADEASTGWGCASSSWASARCRSCSSAASRKDWFESREIIVEAIVGRRRRSSPSSGTSCAPRDPIVDLRILKNRQLAVGVVFAVVLGFALYASVFALPVFLQNLLGYSAWDTGARDPARRHRERVHDGGDGPAGARGGRAGADHASACCSSSGRCGCTPTSRPRPACTTSSGR